MERSLPSSSSLTLVPSILFLLWLDCIILDTRTANTPLWAIRDVI